MTGSGQARGLEQLRASHPDSQAAAAAAAAAAVAAAAAAAASGQVTGSASVSRVSCRSWGYQGNIHPPEIYSQLGEMAL